MRTIRISERVWEAIAERGQFGETEDDVLRRVFELPPASDGNGRGSGSADGRRRARSTRRRNFATKRLTTYVDNQTLVVAFAGGPERRFKLSAREDKAALRRTREEAVEFAEDAGATIGQVNAVKKALTEAGYYLTK